MTKPPASGQNTTSDHLDCQTWILRVYIHCEGCKKKVFKVLHSIDGVYKTVIDSQQHKVIVTGSVDGDTLVRKLLKSGKHSQVLPESFQAKAAADGASGNSKKKKKKQNNKQQDGETTGDDDNKHVEEEEEDSEVTTTNGSTDGRNDKETAEPSVAGGDDNGGGGGGKKKKKKKKQGGKNDNNAAPNGETEGLPAGKPGADTGSIPVRGSMEQLNLRPPGHQMVYATPYDLPPYQNYYPSPAYGMSYSTFYPSAESSYYTPPVYGYAQSHPTIYYPPPPPPSYYRRSAFDDHDDENETGRGCAIM